MKAKAKAFKPTESEFLSLVVSFARLHRWRVAHFRPARVRAGRWVTAVAGDGKGFPDLVLARGGRIVFCELKVGRNGTTPEQDKWLDALRGTAAEVYLWRPSDWQEIGGVPGEGVTMTDEQRVRYWSSFGRRCPYCDGTDIDRDRPECFDDEVSRMAHCENCGRGWKEVFECSEIEESE